MSDNNNKFDFDDEATGPKELREYAKEQAKQNKELQKQLNDMLTKDRTRTVTETLKSKGVDEKVAKFVPTDATTPEAVDAWLAENGDVFGYKPQAQAADEQQVDSGVDNSDLARQFAEFQATTQRATGVQSPGQADPKVAALEKAGKEGGANGILEYLRSVGAAG